MAKGYWVAGLDVNDPVKYDAYRALNGAAFRKYGGRFLVRGGGYENPLGEARTRTVVIEFPSFAAAKACFSSAEYKLALEARGDAIETELVIVEGYDGPQP